MSLSSSDYRTISLMMKFQAADYYTQMA